LEGFPVNDPVVGERLFVDGVVRPVHAEGGSHYVLDGGEKRYGVDLLGTEDERDWPLIVEVLHAGEA
jgi:hypothetical protein